MLSLPAGRQGLILSGAFYPDLKSGFGAVERIKLFVKIFEKSFKEMVSCFWLPSILKI
jgi:hypothetical protein